VADRPIRSTPGLRAWLSRAGSAVPFDWPPVDVEVVHVRVSPATLKHRLRERGPERDRWKLAHWDEYWSEHGARPCAWTNVRLTDFSNDADGVLNQRLERHRIHAPNTVASRRTAPAETFLYVVRLSFD